MDNIFNKKLSEMLGKMDQKMLEAKLNAAFDILKKGDAAEIAKQINKVDKNDLMDKINEFDKTKIKDLNVDMNEVSNKIEQLDLQKLSKLLGENGDEIINKIKDIIK